MEKTRIRKEKIKNKKWMITSEQSKRERTKLIDNIFKYENKLKDNKRERIVQEKAISEGYEVLSKGWPDFLCYKESENKALFIEVKKKNKIGKEDLRPHQTRLLQILKNLGLKVYIAYVE